jgi:hypothetical protein
MSVSLSIERTQEPRTKELREKRSEVTTVEGSLLERGIGFYLQAPPEGGPQEPELMPHVAGMTVLGLSYMVAAGLVAIDGPFPFGDALALGIVAVPDVVWYGIGYSLFD